MSDPDLKTLLDDVKTIKSILQNQDAPLPAVWKPLAAILVPSLVLIAGLKFFVPGLAALGFLDTFLWLWLPVLSADLFVAGLFVSRDLKRTGTRFLAQARVRDFFYSRLIVVPAVVILGYLLSLNPAYPMEGVLLILVALAMNHAVSLVPGRFRSAPLSLLTAGTLELALGWTGPGVTLANTLAVAGILGWMSRLLSLADTEPREVSRG